MGLRKNEKFFGVSESTKQRYLQGLASQIRLLRQAMERSDVNSVREICHQVRGSAGLFGLKDLGDACLSMEKAALERNLSRLVGEFQVVEAVLARNFPLECRPQQG